MSIMGAVAAPVVSGLFGLFGSKKKQETTTRVDYQYIRDAASAAGFNPLTALMNGGSANATTVSNAPALAAQDFVEEALAKSADTFFNRESYAAQRELERLEVDLAREKLAELRKTNSAVARAQSWGYGIPRATNQTGVDDVSGSGLARRSGDVSGAGGAGVQSSAADVNKPAPDTVPLYQWVYDDMTGRRIRQVNPDVADASTPEQLDALLRFGANDAVQNGVPAVLGSRRSKSFDDFLGYNPDKRGPRYRSSKSGKLPYKNPRYAR